MTDKHGNQDETRDTAQSSDLSEDIAMATSSVVDQEVVRQLVALNTPQDPHFFSELVDSFLSSATHKLNGLSESFAKRNSKDLAFHAHALKGSAGNFGAREMVELCSKVEQLAKNDRLDEIEPLLASLTEDFDSVKTWLISFSKLNDSQVLH